MVEVYRQGYFKYDTREIPEFLDKKRITDFFTPIKNCYIKSDVPVELIVNRQDHYTLESGEHFIPFVSMYHSIQIKTETAEVYHCIPVENPNSTLLYYKVRYDTIHPRDDSMCFITTHGITGMEPKNHHEVHFPLQDFANKKQYRYKDRSKCVFRSTIYHRDIGNVMEHPSVVPLRVEWDGFIGFSDPPCASIGYKEKDYPKLAKILKDTFGIRLNPGRADLISKFESYEDMVERIAKENKRIDECPCEFIVTKATPFTTELYEEIKQKYSDPSFEAIPLEELIPL